MFYIININFAYFLIFMFVRFVVKFLIPIFSWLFVNFHDFCGKFISLPFVRFVVNFLILIFSCFS